VRFVRNIAFHNNSNEDVTASINIVSVTPFREKLKSQNEPRIFRLLFEKTSLFPVGILKWEGEGDKACTGGWWN
jgi:hypothetical protein